MISNKLDRAHALSPIQASAADSPINNIRELNEEQSIWGLR